MANPNRTFAAFRQKHGYPEQHKERVRQRVERDRVAKDEWARSFESWEQVAELAQAEDVSALVLTIVRLKSLALTDEWTLDRVLNLAE